MQDKVLNQVIYIKEYIYQKECEEINELQEIVSSKDKVNLKLELDYKLEMYKNLKTGTRKINEFLCYVGDVLVAYMGISCFGGNVAEINGMTHPEWRRKGIFKKLFKLAINECDNRNFNKILLLSDEKSISGIEFIKSLGGEYNFSEYRMELSNNTTVENKKVVNLRKADKSDKIEIERQKLIYFGDEEESKSGVDSNTEETEKIEMDDGFIISDAYMIELNNKVIGKINIEYNNDSAFIFGFGLLPEFRGKGYGKAALKEALKLINERNINKVSLDVAAKNSKALNLYKSCDFKEISVMNYYKYTIDIQYKN
ncbi:GNAT family N-acetyltransferase [Clostridium sp.]|uniref:GNAT family N-acetyltransferase n=1 Tax=Clostridium sp. TaxID=1506 RepID=UPI00283F0C15|nr:GNAT family N-acetyltransferase [Clostridium sp.]MDR3597976.1 GNAT family N-acetyltransferase [Clostridium sp.]